MKKQYVIKKIIIAEDLNEVIRLEKKCPIHEVILDGEWIENNAKEGIGFRTSEKNTAKKKTVSAKAKPSKEKAK